MDGLNNIERHITQADVSRRLNQSNPVPRPNRDPYFERRCWEMRLLQYGGMQEHSIRTTILSGDIHSSKTPMDQLKPVMLRDMKVPMVHKGRYLICQIIGKPSVVVGAEILVEDLNGDVEIVAMYNFYYKVDELDWLRPGVILIIKEPWLRYGSNSKIPTMRIDSPSDVIAVDPNDFEVLNKAGAKKWFKPMSEDADVWREKGNEYFKKGNYKDALILYDRAIRCNQELPVLYLNKSVTCLRMGAFYKAYESAKLAKEKGGDREKAMLRMGQAAYGMREWQKAANHFVEVLKEFPHNTLASEQLKLTTSRLLEQRNGKFDFKQMQFESKKEKAELDVADYTGPIEVVKISGKGRGIIASEDIKEGTLLLVFKAFASGYTQDFPAFLSTINLIRKDSGNAAQMLQVVRAMQNLQNNPQRAKEVYDLYADDMKQDEKIPFGVIDAARLQQISAYNRFGSKDLDKDELKSNIGILSKDNSFLFTLPSYFNHSCLANAFRTFYGDVMAVHATTDIKKGDEIFLSYISPLLDFSIRKKRLGSWKFTCQCQLCQIDAKDKNCLKRNQMVEEFDKYVKTTKYSRKVVAVKGETLLGKVRETYATRNEYKVTLVNLLLTVSQIHFNNGNAKRCLECLEEIETLLDNILKYPFHIAKIFVNMAHCYITLRNIPKAKEMILKAMNASLSDDIDHFKMLYPNIAQHLHHFSF